MSDEINIEVDGTPLKARRGQMLIEATDDAGIYVPRFCYHEKLSIAANCRMCLVEVEKAPKPLPACATPVADGMKVFTKSANAISAQKATMEFLLINHPLDCPICDQGGECELQDLAMGFGRDVSRFTERKRIVKDKNLGPLISTDMTRCIHCTRCVRFGEEIAGIQEMGATGRGEHMEIGTYVERSVDHELSGNIIDLCPVGALNNKPYRYQARAWEMRQQETISPHDCAGSNLFAHVLRGKVMRVVPRPNEQINETWISDRDRFGFEGIYSEDRLRRPMAKHGGEWRECDWETALGAAVAGLKSVVAQHGANRLGSLVGPSATVEEGYLLARLVNGMESRNIDHRLRRRDFGDQYADPLFPWLGMSIADIDSQEALLVVGANLRKEVPILAHRVRKAALDGAKVMLLSHEAYEYLFPVAQSLTVKPEALAESLAAILSAAARETGKDIPNGLGALASAANPTADHRSIAKTLINARSGAIFLGQVAQRHPGYSKLRALAAGLAELCGKTLGYLPEGANSAGACLAGVLPHRGPGGSLVDDAGLTAYEMIDQQQHIKAWLLFGMEPEDCAYPEQAQDAFQEAEFVVCMTPYATDAARKYADVLLPVGTFAETSGTFVNVEGRWQSFAGVALPVHESRPGWKVLRVLGNLLELAGFEYLSSEAIRDELRSTLGEIAPDNSYEGELVEPSEDASEAADGTALDVPIYAIDGLVRRARALQLTRDGRAGSA